MNINETCPCDDGSEVYHCSCDDTNVTLITTTTSKEDTMNIEEGTLVTEDDCDIPEEVVAERVFSPIPRVASGRKCGRCSYKVVIVPDKKTNRKKNVYTDLFHARIADVKACENWWRAREGKSSLDQAQADREATKPHYNMNFFPAGKKNEALQRAKHIGGAFKPREDGSGYDVIPPKNNS